MNKMVKILDEWEAKVQNVLKEGGFANAHFFRGYLTLIAAHRKLVGGLEYYKKLTVLELDSGDSKYAVQRDYGIGARQTLEEVERMMDEDN